MARDWDVTVVQSRALQAGAGCSYSHTLAQMTGDTWMVAKGWGILLECDKYHGRRKVNLSQSAA